MRERMEEEETMLMEADDGSRALSVAVDTTPPPSQSKRIPAPKPSFFLLPFSLLHAPRLSAVPRVRD